MFFVQGFVAQSDVRAGLLCDSYIRQISTPCSLNAEQVELPSHRQERSDLLN
jgi:hypothetical protein